MISIFKLKPALQTTVVVAANIWLLVACKSEPTCDYSEAPYMSATSVPSLQAPEGLTAPDRSGALTIPPAAPDEKPITPGKGKCLDRPPSYFSSSPEKK